MINDSANRDRVAIAAMQALLTVYAVNIYTCEEIAEEAYDMADAMISESLNRINRDKKIDRGE